MDRKRRLDSLKKIVDQCNAPEWTNCCTTGSQLRELHELAVTFCNLTVSISTKNGEGNNDVFMEGVASWQKLEVPDDDTSSLLQAQVCYSFDIILLNAVSIYRLMRKLLSRLFFITMFVHMMGFN